VVFDTDVWWQHCACDCRHQWKAINGDYEDHLRICELSQLLAFFPGSFESSGLFWISTGNLDPRCWRSDKIYNSMCSGGREIVAYRFPDLVQGTLRAPPGKRFGSP
jgi:hypothetical protein